MGQRTTLIRDWTRLFTDPFRQLIGRTVDSGLLEDAIQPVVLVGNAPANSGTLPVLTTPGGLKVGPYPVAQPPNAAGTNLTAFSSLDVGEWEFVTASGAGADRSVPTSVASGSEMLLWCEAVRGAMECDGTAVSRSVQLEVRKGWPIGAVTEFDQHVSAAISLEASEFGEIFMSAQNAFTFLNDNGTITTEQTSPFPMTVSESAFLATLDVTANLQAADTLLATALVWRLA